MSEDAQVIGKRVQLKGDHPHSGSVGTIIRVGDTIFGRRPVVKLESGLVGQECYIMKPGQAAELPPS